MNDINSVFLYAIPSLVTLVSILLTWIIFNRENDKTYLKERYEKVIFPIFSLLENHLYQKNIDSELKTALDTCKIVIEQNKYIAGGKLIDLFKRPYTLENFQEISSLIDKEYDTCCSKLGIPLRSIDNKVNSFGTRNIRVFILFCSKSFIPFILIMGIMCYLMLNLFNFVYK